MVALKTDVINSIDCSISSPTDCNAHKKLRSTKAPMNVKKHDTVYEGSSEQELC